jgi:hypothetical protein
MSEASDLGRKVAELLELQDRTMVSLRNIGATAATRADIQKTILHLDHRQAKLEHALQLLRKQAETI